MSATTAAAPRRRRSTLPVESLTVGAVVVALASAAATPASPPIIAAAVLGLCVLVVLSVRLGYLQGFLHVLVASIFAESLSVGGLRIGRVLAVVVVLVLVGRLLFTSWHPPRVLQASWVPITAYLALVWASGLWSDDFGAWFESVAALSLALAYYAAVVLLVESEDHATALLRTYAGCATVAGVLAIAQTRTGGRAAGLQGDPNIFALYEIVAIPAAALLARRATSRYRAALWLSTIAIDIAAVVASQSRGGLLSLVVVLVVLALRGDFGSAAHRSRVRQTLAVALVVCVTLATALLIGGRLAPTRAAEDGGSGRVDIWRVAIVAWAEHPVLGIGSGNFQSQSTQLLRTTPGVEISAVSPILTTGIKVHNVYLEALVELGFLGLLLWIGILCNAGRMVMSTVGLTADRTPWSALLPMLGALAVATVFLSVNNNKALWLLLALAAVAGKARPRTTGIVGGPR